MGADTSETARVREAAAAEAPKHKRLLRSERDGRVLSALRMRGGTFAGTAHELHDPAELEQAREAICETVVPNDYGECALHLRGRPTREKIKELHRYWFDTGIPVVVELKETGTGV